MKSAIHNILLLALVSVAALGTVQGQEQAGVRERADQAFEQMQYHRAAQLYERLAQRKRAKTSDLERLAASYRLISSYELAENWYARAAQRQDFSKHGMLHYADVLKMNGRYAEAKIQYTKYLAQYDSTPEVELALAGTDSAIHWMAHPTGEVLHNESGINTDLSEFGAVPTSGGVIYAGEPKIYDDQSEMTGRAYLKIFSGSRDRAGAIGSPTLMPDVFNNARYHVGPIAANANEDVLYVTRTYPGTEQETYRKNGVKWRKANLELKIYTRAGDTWTETDFPYNNVQEYSLGHASLSDDEQTLYFASDMPGGHGGVDIWYSELQADGSWGVPQNAGSTINSSMDEMFPTISGMHLYYSSNGFAGMGGLDIYHAIGSRDSFSSRENLGYPLNSAADDFAYVGWADEEENRYGYLSSNRPGGIGGDDIYSFTYTKPRITIVLKGLTKNKETGESLPASTVTLRLADRTIVSRTQSDGAAVFEFSLDKNTEYQLYGEKEKFYPDSLRIAAVNPLRDTTIYAELHLQPIYTVGTKFVLENIYYDFDKHNIRPDAAKILDEVVAVLRDNPTLKIELSSHTDSRGTHRYNDALSQRRATAAVEYIVGRGIARDRLVAKGYGERRLVNECADGVRCSIEQHQANRRTEIEVLEY